MRKIGEETMLVDSVHSSDTRIAIVDGKNQIRDLLLDCTGGNSSGSIKDNIYLGTVVRVEHSLQCAFVDFGGDKNGFLSFSEIHYDYYQLPSSDKEVLKEEAKRGAVNENVDEDDMGHGKRSQVKKYGIQEVIKRGQNVLVQVFRDSQGSKGPSLTTYISLSGRYCVLMPNSNSGIGLSKKISNVAKRKELLYIAKNLPLLDGMGMVLRTASIEVAEEELSRDFYCLAEIWNNVRARTFSSKSPSLIYSCSNLIQRAIRDHYGSSVGKVIVSSKLIGEVKDAFNGFMLGDEIDKISEYKGKRTLFASFGISDQFDSLLSPRVDLPSGGYLIIDQTEALVSIDVNSGKSTSSNDIEEMAVAINMEAAVEVPRQLRLRGLGGLIVVDFIDMSMVSNRKKIEELFNKGLEKDRARVRTVRISQFGLMECSRQRLYSSIYSVCTLPCSGCNGAGFVRSGQFLAYSIVGDIKNNALMEGINSVKVVCSNQAKALLSKEKGRIIDKFGKESGIDIEIVSSSSVMHDAYFIYNVMQINNKESDVLLKENKGCTFNFAKSKVDADDFMDFGSKESDGFSDKGPSRSGGSKFPRKPNNKGVKMWKRDKVPHYKKKEKKKSIISRIFSKLF
ncbi:Rne/Rng family ribonuclease [Rickettsiales bacterium]|nr:Rne/Rng family ribonuclease [Rickettsiales bacterium]